MRPATRRDLINITVALSLRDDEGNIIKLHLIETDFIDDIPLSLKYGDRNNKLTFVENNLVGLLLLSDVIIQYLVLCSVLNRKVE